MSNPRIIKDKRKSNVKKVNVAYSASDKNNPDNLKPIFVLINDKDISRLRSRPINPINPIYLELVL